MATGGPQPAAHRRSGPARPRGNRAVSLACQANRTDHRPHRCGRSHTQRGPHHPHRQRRQAPKDRQTRCRPTPHRRHRQHHAQPACSGTMPTLRGILVLPRPLHGRVRALYSVIRGRAGTGRCSPGRGIGTASNGWCPRLGGIQSTTTLIPGVPPMEVPRRQQLVSFKGPAC